MNRYASQDLRNICLVGPQGEGKTTLLESMLFRAGAVPRRGTVEEGTTASDHTDEERERGMSVHLSVSHLEYKGKKINIIDTPGYADFEGDMRAGLAAVDAAVLVISGAGGISPAAESCWEFLHEKKVPVVVFLNKMDKGAADFNSVYHELQERLGREIIDIDVPEYENGMLKREVSLLEERVPDEDVPR